MPKSRYVDFRAVKQAVTIVRFSITTSSPSASSARTTASAGHGAKFWIITEWDHSATTVLMPEDC